MLQVPPKLLEENELKLSQMEQKMNEIAELNPHVVILVESASVTHMLQFLNWLWYFFVSESKKCIVERMIATLNHVLRGKQNETKGTKINNMDELLEWCCSFHWAIDDESSWEIMCGVFDDKTEMLQFLDQLK